MLKVKRTERGWGAHFIAAPRCLFRRNTLLEYNTKKWVISTVGNYVLNNKLEEIGLDRYSETMAFEAKLVNGKYWDADVTKQIDFNSNWALGKVNDDNLINDMHEQVVKELSEKIKE